VRKKIIRVLAVSADSTSTLPNDNENDSIIYYYLYDASQKELNTWMSDTVDSSVLQILSDEMKLLEKFQPFPMEEPFDYSEVKHCFKKDFKKFLIPKVLLRQRFRDHRRNCIRK